MKQWRLLILPILNYLTFHSDIHRHRKIAVQAISERRNIWKRFIFRWFYWILNYTQICMGPLKQCSEMLICLNRITEYISLRLILYYNIACHSFSVMRYSAWINGWVLSNLNQHLVICYDNLLWLTLLLILIVLLLGKYVH